MTMLRRPRALITLLVLLTTMACASPEATRTRGGGPGGDIGNHDPMIQIHGPVNPYFETPSYGKALAK